MTDGCEWNPENDVIAKYSDWHHNNEPARVILGCDTSRVRSSTGVTHKGNWRLCAACARRKVFSHLRKRMSIEPQKKEAQDD